MKSYIKRLNKFPTAYDGIDRCSRRVFKVARNFNRVRLVVVQPGESVYFDKYYDDVLMAIEKFNYFCKLARVNHSETPSFVFDRTDKYNEMSAYFPENEDNSRNQSGFVQVSMYFEVAPL